MALSREQLALPLVERVAQELLQGGDSFLSGQLQSSIEQSLTVTQVWGLK